MTICENIEIVTKRINAAKMRADRTDEVNLIAVSKRQSADKIREGIESGIRMFGENRVQEAAMKWGDLKKVYPNTELHLIGALQTNKVKEAVQLFDVIQTLDRPKLVNALAQEMERAEKRIPCFIQVNSGKELQKSGVMPEDVAQLVSYAKERHVDVVGLMCIPPVDQSPEPYFADMQRMGASLKLPCLSMGMSGDYETAITYGATHIRVGTAIFGEREE